MIITGTMTSFSIKTIQLKDHQTSSTNNSLHQLFPLVPSAHLFLWSILTSKSSPCFSLTLSLSLSSSSRSFIHSFINSFNVHFHFPYTHLNKFSTSSERMSRRITIGCSQGLALSNLRKYGLQALNTT